MASWGGAAMARMLLCCCCCALLIQSGLGADGKFFDLLSISLLVLSCDLAYRSVSFFVLSCACIVLGSVFEVTLC